MEQHSCCCRPSPTIALPGTFDGLLLFAAHEVLTSPEALDHLLPISTRGVGSWHSGPNSNSATRQTFESAPPSAYPNLIASIERSSGCSSLAILGRSNRQASCGRTHGGIVLSGWGMPAISRIQTFWGATARRRDQGVLTPTARLRIACRSVFRCAEGAHRGLRSEWAP